MALCKVGKFITCLVITVSATSLYLSGLYSLLSSSSVLVSICVDLVTFILVNSYENFSVGSEQNRWLEAELLRANQDRSLRPWIIVCFHSPIYPSSSGHAGNDGLAGDKQFQAAIEPLLLSQHVDLCFTGHDHGYERSYPVFAHRPVISSVTDRYVDKQLPIHLLVGTAGATQDPWSDVRPTWSLHRELGVGYVNLHVFSNHSLLVRYLRSNNTIGDQFWLIRTPRSKQSTLLALVDVNSYQCRMLIFVAVMLVSYNLYRYFRRNGKFVALRLYFRPWIQK